MSSKKNRKPKARQCAVQGCTRITLHTQCAEHRSGAAALFKRLMAKASA